MDGHAQRLALDVPQRLVDAGERAHQHRPAAIEAAAVEHLPVVLDPERVLADQEVGQFRDRWPRRVRAPLDDRLAPARDPLVGLDLEEQPARRDEVGLQRGDLHGTCNPLQIPTGPDTIE